MAIGWFIADYKRRLGIDSPTRYCAMDDYTVLIRADGGIWHESEVLGNRAIVKVRAAPSTLTTIAADANIRRLPKDALNISLSDLTTPQKNAIRNELLDAGYTAQELTARFGADLGAFTLGDVLRFMASRRLKPRYDKPTDTIILDGAIQPVRPIDDIDARVQ